MKTAKELFEELGYKAFGKSSEFVMYENQEHNYYITFKLSDRTIQIYKPHTTFDLIFYKELQAINKQVEELGWNE